MSITIWHNPKCSKSRQTLELLKEKAISPEVRLYLKDVPTVDELKILLDLLDIDPRALMRTKEAEYKAEELHEKQGDELIDAMVKHPKLIERPIVINGNKAAIGRPPENILAIL